MPEFRRSGLEDANSGREVAKRKAEDMSFEKPEGFIDTPYEARERIKAEERKIAPARIYEPKCKTCMHPYRDFIETMLVKGQPYKAIESRVPGSERRSIANHYKNHMDLEDAAMRFILEKEAELQGQNYEEGVQDAITKRGVLEVMLRKGYEDIRTGVTTVEARDLIQLVKLLSEMDSHAHQAGLDEARAQVQLFIQAIKDVCGRDIQAEIAARVKVLRSREGLGSDFENSMQPVVGELESPKVEIVEAEVVG